ncbi:MAG TPA: cupin domain-containing protein [Candidatus Binatia bacterium]|nr:cupin domain-containing protein [Candidatus Binatia bacterium]
MKNRFRIAAFVFCLGTTVGFIAERLLHAQNEPVRRTSLLTTELEGIPGKEVDVFIVEIAPGASTGKHSHPGSEIAYILEGTAGVEAEGNNFSIPQRRGSVSYLKPNEVHNVSNPSRTEPLKAIVFAVNDKGKPKIAPAK